MAASYLGSPRAREFDPLGDLVLANDFAPGPTKPAAQFSGPSQPLNQHADPFSGSGFPLVDPFADDPFAPSAPAVAGAASHHRPQQDSLDLDALFAGLGGGFSGNSEQAQLDSSSLSNGLGGAGPGEQPEGEDDDDDDDADDDAEDDEDVRRLKTQQIHKVFASTQFPKSPRLQNGRRLPGAVPALPRPPLHPLAGASGSPAAAASEQKADELDHLDIPQIFVQAQLPSVSPASSSAPSSSLSTIPNSSAVSGQAAPVIAISPTVVSGVPPPPQQALPAAQARVQQPSHPHPGFGVSGSPPPVPVPQGQPSAPLNKPHHRQSSSGAVDLARVPSPSGGEPAAASGDDRDQLLIRKMSIDVLGFMRDGSPFLKYGRRGYPKFRFVQVSRDNQRILWFSDSKALRDTQIRIADVVEIRAGQTTKVFRRMPSEELSPASFSLIYRKPRPASRRLSFGSNNNGLRNGSGGSARDSAGSVGGDDPHLVDSLDLVAKDPNEDSIWFAGLTELLRLSRANQLRADIESILVEIPIRRGRRSSVGLIDHATGEEAFDPAAAAQLARLRNDRVGEVGSKLDYRRSHDRLVAFKADVLALRDKLRKPKYREHPSWPALRAMFDKTKRSLLMSADNYKGGDFVSCEDDLWRGRVNLDAVKTMMAAMKHS